MAESGNCQQFSSHNLIPSKTVLTDFSKQLWSIDYPLKYDSQTALYKASKVGNRKKKYVMKIVKDFQRCFTLEAQCYKMIAVKENIQKWMQDKQIDHLGVISDYGFGVHRHLGVVYEFLVLEKIDADLETVLKEKEFSLSLKEIYSIAVNIIDALEYMHSFNYIHCDIQASNILLKNDGDYKAYLVNMGQCRDYKAIRRYKAIGHSVKSYDGFLIPHLTPFCGSEEFASRHTHIECYSPRNDLESLSFNLLYWISGKLPWSKDLVGTETLLQQKKWFMDNLDAGLDMIFEEKGCPAALKKLLHYVDTLKLDTRLDYTHCKEILNVD